MSEKLSMNMEDYLETIHLLGEKQKNVRVRDIAKQMDITMPSVSGALRNLERQDLVRHPRYDMVELTKKGLAIAEGVYRRHCVIRNFLFDVLGIGSEIAEKDACGMEHSVSPETLERLVSFLDTQEKDQIKVKGIRKQ